MSWYKRLLLTSDGKYISHEALKFFPHLPSYLDLSTAERFSGYTHCRQEKRDVVHVGVVVGAYRSHATHRKRSPQGSQNRRMDCREKQDPVAV